MPTPSITAIILTHNSADTITAAINSVKFCRHIIVIDDYSTDATTTIAARLGATVHQHALNHDFASQHNVGLRQASTDWVLFIDSDEVVPKQLAQEILFAIQSNTGIAGYCLRRQDTFLGRQLRHGETGQASFVRLGKRGAGVWRRPVHEVWEISAPATLSTPLQHTPHPNLNIFLDKINHYSDIDSRHRFQAGQSIRPLSICIWPIGKFLYNYVFKRGFLDGFPGFIMAYMMSLHSLVTRIKLYELQSQT